MKTLAEPIVKTHYVSEAHPEISSERPSDGPLIEWADAHPDAWRVVMGAKSKAWGRSATHYFESEQGRSDPGAVLGRLATFHRYLTEHRPREAPAYFDGRVVRGTVPDGARLHAKQYLREGKRR